MLENRLNVLYFICVSFTYNCYSFVFMSVLQILSAGDANEFNLQNNVGVKR